MGDAYITECGYAIMGYAGMVSDNGYCIYNAYLAVKKCNEYLPLPT
jgi:hypothetical protein